MQINNSDDSKHENIDNSLGHITYRMIDILRFTKPWTRFISIIGFIIVTLTIILSISGIFTKWSDTGQDSHSFFLLGLINVLWAIIYLVPSIYLFKYSSSVNRLIKNNDSLEIENALEYQRVIWKFIGIFIILIPIILFLSVMFMNFILE